MTTRAGKIGIISGLIAALLAFFYTRLGLGFSWIIALSLLLTLPAGALAARHAGSRSLWRCILLGAVCGALAMTLLYCFWGAATLADSETNWPALLRANQSLFTGLFGAACLLGGLGGGLVRIGRVPGVDEFDKLDPQMAMNTAITAVPASLFALLLALAFYPALERNGLTARVFLSPVRVGMGLLLMAQIVLAMVTRHEARQAEHRTGMDEVKMAAFVGIACAPATILGFAFIYPPLFTYAWCWVGLAGIAALSLVNLDTLRRSILPRRALLPGPQGEVAQKRARWFGSIPSSQAWRLVQLCTGCGLVMVLPACVILVAPGLDLLAVRDGSGRLPLALQQVLVNGGLMVGAAGLLSLIYLFYLNLGRWFTRKDN